MKVKYVGESKSVESVGGKEVKLDKGTVLECMEREFFASAIVRATLDSGDRVKVKRAELQKV
ncbi:MAG: hypothetical protein K8I29_18735 [Alphaproteobacteria bacterium]|uniref:Uncharacterized protein n=1 Tax=Candidatus Nitrobium versatile TaxID=2884831 RepID=A0A953M3F4_9BACT|nr:hypothetical protein [Candidatus Nitrobium versatile]